MIVRFNMIEQTLRRFCETPYRWPIVIGGTFVVGLVLVMPLVDAYRAGLNEQEALRAELDAARQVASGLDSFRKRTAEKLSQLEVFEGRTVDEESLPMLRGKLVDLAKESGCNIRRLSAGAAGTRPWIPGDDPTGPASGAKPNGPDSVFVLSWQPMSISLHGTSANLRTLLERITSAGMLMHTKSFELYPSSASRQSLTLDMELWYFTLKRRG
jgi:hypothetical protein